MNKNIDESAYDKQLDAGKDRISEKKKTECNLSLSHWPLIIYHKTMCFYFQDVLSYSEKNITNHTNQIY